MKAVLQAVAASSSRISSEGGGSLFSSSKGGQKDNVLNLSEDALIKGGAAGIVQHVLEEIVKKAIALYPPP